MSVITALTIGYVTLGWGISSPVMVIWQQVSPMAKRADRSRIAIRMHAVCIESTAVFHLLDFPSPPFVKSPFETYSNPLNSIPFYGIGEGGALTRMSGKLNGPIVGQIKTHSEVL